MEQITERLVYLLEAAKEWIDEVKDQEGHTVNYDDADCDGYCLSDDIGNAIDEYRFQKSKQK